MNKNSDKAYINKAFVDFKNMGIKSPILELTRGDLEKGVSKEDILLYAQTNMDYEHKRMFSKCLREGINKDLINVIVDNRLNAVSMEFFLEAYRRGITKEELESMLAENNDDYQSAIMKALVEFENHGNVPEWEVMKKVVGSLETIAKQVEANVQKVEELENQVRTIETKEQKDKEVSGKNNKTAEKADNGADKNSSVTENTDKDADKNYETREQAGKTTKESEEVTANNGIKMYYQIPVGKETIVTERTSTAENTIGTMMRKIFMSKLSNRSLVQKVIKKELSKEQLEQIRVGLAKGLDNSQLVTLINSNADAGRMEKIIEIAVLVNEQKRGSD